MSQMLCAILLTLSTGPILTAAAAPKTNFLIIVADDLGFCDLGCYGGEIATPRLDQLAADGLRFTQFYNTGRCWPTRSAILTGYYPQQIRMDPPYGRLPTWTRLLPHYLTPLGYRSYQSGKWHVNGAPQVIADGGFDRSYKVDDQNQFFGPQKHTRDDQPLPAVPVKSDYYLTSAIADHAIECLKEHQAKHSAQPFFQYLAFTSPHFPLHALPEDIAKYRDVYAEGWDSIRQRRWQKLKDAGIIRCELPPLDEDFTPRYLKDAFLNNLGTGEVKNSVLWNKLSDEQKRFQAEKMAIHAAMVDRMDRDIGRVIDQVRAMNAIDDTVIIFLSDNGADATILVRGGGHDPAASMGSAATYLCIGPGWASACNTPFRWHKVWNHEGGISTPLIVHWPKRIAAKGELRHDVGHVIDVVPTLLEIAGAEPAKTWNGVETPPLPGRSILPALTKNGSLRREFLFFQHEGNRALRMGDMKLVSARERNDVWELYDLAIDRSEMKDLAAAQPDRVREMGEFWSQKETEFRQLAGPPPANEKAKKTKGKKTSD